jgi:hypothetical protein
VLADNLDNMPAKEEPKPEVDLYTLVKECAAAQDLESEECVVVLEHSGLSVDEFKAKFAAKLGYLAKKEPLSAAAKTCHELMASLNGKRAGESADELSALSDKINYVCHKALVESRMSPGQFWTKYRLKTHPASAAARVASVTRAVRSAARGARTNRPAPPGV